MDRAYSSGAVGTPPAAPASPSIGYPTAGSLSGGIPTTKQGAYWYHMVMEELMGVVSAAGLTPSQSDLTQLAKAIRTISPAVVGTVRNAKMTVTAASASAAFTADEVVVESALGGAAYKIASFNKTVSLATTGAGGMDTGSAPISGYVALYAIYNPTTGASALLAVNATSAAAPNVYGGASMPTGYTASALVSVWPTNSSGQFIVSFQRDRKVWRGGVLAFSGSATAPTSVSISSIVPLNATEIFGTTHYIGNNAAGGNLYIMPDAAGTGQQTAISSGANVADGGNFSMPLITPQTLYYYGANISTGDATINGYSF